MQIISIIALYNYKVSAIIKNFKFCPGKSWENFHIFFAELINKIQGLFTTAKKNPGLFQDVATLSIVWHNINKAEYGTICNRHSFSVRQRLLLRYVRI